MGDAAPTFEEVGGFGLSFGHAAMLWYGGCRARDARLYAALTYVLDGDDAHVQLPRGVGTGDLLHARATDSWALQWHDQSAGGGAALEGVRVRARARFRYVYFLFPICLR